MNEKIYSYYSASSLPHPKRVEEAELSTNPKIFRRKMVRVGHCIRQLTERAGAGVNEH